MTNTNAPAIAGEARPDPDPHAMTASQALDDIIPVMTKLEAEAWLYESRVGLDQIVDDPFLYL